MELATHVRDVLAGHGIRFWLDDGALLGAVRERALIPWDSDVDFGVLASDMPSVRALTKEIQSYGHEVDASDPLLFRVYYSKFNRFHLDLCGWTERDGRLTFPEWPGWEWPGNAGKGSFPPTYLDSMTTAWLAEEPFPAPSPVETFLAEHRYGPLWRTPVRPMYFGRAPTLGPEEMTDQVRDLIETLVGVHERLDALTAHHLLGHTENWRRWVDAGAPRHPDSAIVDTLVKIHGAPTSAVARDLIEQLAVLCQALDEQSAPTPSTVARAYRRRVEYLMSHARSVVVRRSGAGRGAVS
jgi:hypothetical protein